jgi:hypothetical protein
MPKKKPHLRIDVLRAAGLNDAQIVRVLEKEMILRPLHSDRMSTTLSPNRSDQANEYLYVIGRKKGPIKVGVSSNPQSRLKSIQTGCAFPIKNLFQVRMLNRDQALGQERAFHEIHAGQRLHGEWFDMDAELAIESIETGIHIDAHLAQRQRCDIGERAP